MQSLLKKKPRSFFYRMWPRRAGGDRKISYGIDHLTPYFVSGWIVEEESDRTLSFDVRIDGKTVARGLKTEVFRPDLAARFGNQGHFGYQIAHDGVAKNTTSALIEIVDAETQEVLAHATKLVRKRIGNIDAVQNGQLIGWCHDPADLNPVMIDVYIDGELSHSALKADQLRKDVQMPGTEGMVGFSATLAGVHQLSLESIFRVVHHTSGEEICTRAASDLLTADFLDVSHEKNKQVATTTVTQSLDTIRPFFDKYFYTQMYGIEPELDPVLHYVKQGWHENKDPAPWFSTRFYLEEYSDVRENGVNPFLHYIRRGRQEGRAPMQDPGTVVYDVVSRSDEATPIRVTRCLRKQGKLFVEGYARHPQYSGLPIRIDIGLEDQNPVRILTRDVRSSGVEGEEGHLFFKCDLDATTVTDRVALCIGLAGSKSTAIVDLTAITPPKPKIMYPAPASDWPVVGVVDRVSATKITGWALYTPSPNTPLTLILSFGGVPVASVKCHIFRSDLRTTYGGDLFAGFVFDIPPEVAAQQVHTQYTIAPAIGENQIQRWQGSIPRSGAIAFDSERKVQHEMVPVAPPVSDEPVSAIVLNLNGEDILRDLLETSHVYEDPAKIEWIIVDHGSQDNSHAVAQEALARGQRVRFICRNGNLSFSNSNNYGASLAKHDALIFLNNDLIFRAPFRKNVLGALEAPSVGAVGALLYDYLPDDASPEDAPVQHVGVCFYRQIERKWIRPFELRPIPGQVDQIGSVLDVPVATGAFLALRRADFEAIGGFSEEYVYGLEDVDLCMKVRTNLRKRVVCDTRLDIVHHRGFSRVSETNIAIRQRNNNDHFNACWSLPLRKALRSQIATRPAYWNGSTPVVAFIVADVGENSSAGEYFTAYELGQQLQNFFPCQIRFLTEAEWYNLEGIDVLIAMVSHFDIQNAKRVNPFMVTINWTRQWFDRWAYSDSIHAYDIVYASSQIAADFLSEKTGIDVHVLPIATDFDRFSTGSPQEDYTADYCFTGNFSGTNREIMYQLKPETINAVGAVYGHGWTGMPFESIWRGPVSYGSMPDVYASSKIVIDDANIATKGWGSCNSRVFDAIAGGCLLITNGPRGVQELFGDKVPTYDSAETLRDTIEYWVTHEDERQQRVQELQEIVRAKHTYERRAKTVFGDLSSGTLKPRIAIKCPAIWAERESWGDYHFALSLATELRKLGFVVRVDCRENWFQGIAVTDDVNIMLRGILPFDPPPHQRNILWLISHPADIPASELEKYDHVYTASDIHRERLADVVNVPVETLLQCTDTNRFYPGQVAEDVRGQAAPLFVGNSRGVFRHSVRWAVETEKDIDLYGKGWEQFVKDHRFKGQFIPNDVLPQYYEKARVVLCDHWEDMSRYGYLSNRAFDVLACGSWLAVDEVAGLANILPGGYTVFRTKEDLCEILEAPGLSTWETRKSLANWVAQNHTFRNRAEVIAARVRALLPGEIDATGYLPAAPVQNP